MIKRIWFVLLALIASCVMATGQDNMIAICPMVSDALDIPSEARAALEQKLRQMSVQNGFGATGGPFVLTADVRTVDKQVTATAPAQYVVDLEVSVYVVNLQEQMLAAETSFPVRSIENSENRAVVRAINRINPKTPEVRRFMDTAREQILTYYAARIPAIVASAQSLADRGEYDSALAELANVPQSLDEYPMVAEKMTAIYVQKLNRTASSAIQEAKSRIALRDYEGAMASLLAVDPSSDMFEEASAMVDNIKSSIDAEEERKLQAELAQMEAQKELSVKMHDDEVMLKKMQIEAYESVETARAMNEEKTRVSLKEWLMGKLK